MNILKLISFIGYLISIYKKNFSDFFIQRVFVVAVVKVSSYSTGVAKERPSNLFLRPLKLCVIWKKVCKNQINVKIFKTCLIFLSIAIKNDDKRGKMGAKLFSALQNFKLWGHTIWKSLNLALEKKSLVTPGIVE